MYGLLGQKLAHSFSPQIHSLLGEYEYKLFELEPEDVEAFIKSNSFDGINVTIPYKKTVMPYIATLAPNAKKIGSVNTVVRNPDGSLYGDNTDYDGFMYLVKSSKVDFAGKKVLVLGTGGASLAIIAVVKDLHAKELVNISRSGKNNYENISNHSDADIIINTTPVGMYPNNLISPVKLNIFTHLSAIFDIIYNPNKTKLILDAESLAIPAFSGLPMLVAQAKRSSEIFFDSQIPDSTTESILSELNFQMKNIILIGMPGSGKSSIGKLLSDKLNREFIDTDDVIVKSQGVSIPEIFKDSGEKEFRRIETEVIKDVCRQSEKIIATGGGIVTVEENYNAIRQNATVIFINRRTDALPTDGRPLSQSNSLTEMFEKRLPLYRRFCNIEIDGNGSIEEVAQRIIRELKK